MNETFLQQRWLQTAAGKICYYLDKSFENRPTVVMLHGLSANHTTWLTAAKRLREMRINCLAPDLRGHGLSDKTKSRRLYKYSIFSDDLRQILGKEQIKNTILAGYSFGGFIALDFITKYRDSVTGLILISANHVNPLKYKHLNFFTWPVYGFLLFLAWLFLWQKKKDYHYFVQGKSKGYWHSTFKGLSTMPLSINLWMLAETAYLDFKDLIGQITCPTLILRGNHDPFLSKQEARDIAQKIPQARVDLMENSSHFLASRFQEILWDKIINFLKEKNLL